MKKAAAAVKNVEKRPLAKAPKAAPKPKALQVVADDESEGPTPNAKKTKRTVASPVPVAGSRPARAARAATTKAYIVDDDDDDDESGSDAEQDFSEEDSDDE